MAEISYPFSQSNDSGGSEMVSQAQWQKMNHLGGDRIDFWMTAATYDSGTLPFGFNVLNGRNVVVAPGRAIVGGFYYELDQYLTVPMAANPGDKARIDTIVLRADLAKGSVNMVAVQGQPGTTPIAPQPQRVLGQMWEMVLYEVTVPAANGPVVPYARLQFDSPPAIYSPWNTADTAPFIPNNSFIYDLDVNGGDSQNEMFKGRDGLVTSRHLGGMKNFTSSVGNVNFQPAAADRIVRWRWIAPNVVFFSLRISNPSANDIKVANGNWFIDVQLPQPVNGKATAQFSGYMENTHWAGGYPYMTMLFGHPWAENSQTIHLFQIGHGESSNGVNGLDKIPAYANVYISGVYESTNFAY